MEPSLKIQAARIAEQNAHAKPTHMCAKYVRRAIQLARGEPDVGTGLEAKDYGKWLEDRGYKKVNKTPEEAVAGTVGVIAGAPSHPQGHIAIKTEGGKWVSDFKQNNFKVYSAPIKYALYE